ncbi:hypothetical protein AB833_26320 [Chromatiales bacterium (ex Bugula neritina AB1)]|nr:hypothetical protein AB833_26320 [Chromatiales bacterium (ex Bugula neritina AB1)]
MPPIVRAVISWAIALWACRVFLQSLPYKYSLHPDTQHIFGTIGEWISGFLGPAIGNAFSNFGSYVVGTFELATSVVLLVPAVLWVLRKALGKPTSGIRAKYHTIGGLMAAMVMGGAVFFHLFSPLGIEVLHEGENDGGSLFYAALSILIGGITLFFVNRSASSTVSYETTGENSSEQS